MTIPIKPGLLGDPLAPGSVGPRQVVANPATKAASPPIAVNWFCRNSKHPSAQYWNQLNEATNQAPLYRTKELFSFVNHTSWKSWTTSVVGSAARWRAAFHTSKYSHAIGAVVVMLPPDAGYDQNTHGKLTIYSDTAEAVTVASETFTYGPGPTGTTRTLTLPYWKVITKVIGGLSADTDYYCKFTNETYGLIMSATIFDLQSMTENFSGYNTQNLTSQSEILDTYRQNVVTMQNNMMKRGAAKVFNWSVDDGTAPITIAVATPTNLINQTSTTVTAATPGFTLDMRNKARLSQSSGVPVAMKVFCKTTAAGGNGEIYLTGSGGPQIAITNGIPVSPSAGWVSATGYLPATEDKYDIHFHNNGAGTFSVYAVCVYQYET